MIPEVAGGQGLIFHKPSPSQSWLAVHREQGHSRDTPIAPMAVDPCHHLEPPRGKAHSADPAWHGGTQGPQPPACHALLQPPLRVGLFSRLTFPEDWMPLTTAIPTMLQATRRHRVIFQLRPPLSEMELEMSRASRYQK